MFVVEVLSYFLIGVTVRYNNQWMLVDYKMFVPSAPRLGDGLLFLHEQLPLVT